jgi:hypothetical protein
MANDEKRGFTRRELLAASVAGATGLGMSSLGRQGHRPDAPSDQRHRLDDTKARHLTGYSVSHDDPVSFIKQTTVDLPG